MWFGYTPQVSHRLHERLVAPRPRQAPGLSSGDIRLAARRGSRRLRIESANPFRIGGRGEAQVHKFSFHLRTAAICAVSSAVALSTVAPYCLAQTPSAKKYKDGEYDLVNQAYKDAADGSKEIADLDAWSQKFPNSDYQEDREYLYVQAHVKLNQPVKVLEYGSKLMSRDLGAIFNGPGTAQLAGLPIQLTMLNVLYSVALHATAIPEASAEQLALGQKAAQALLDFAPKYFIPGNKPAAQSDQGGDQ